ncbi:MAG: DUF1016 domain-containing protein [Proteobacteria bacterium]|nr:DUF1016 domain-containing protein [Pseudomonadota bacterium]
MTKDEFSLFERIVTILEQSRSRVGRTINSSTVTAYWLIGRETVEEIQKGEQRAGYGNKVIEELSGQLNKQYGKGFSTTNLRYFRKFYLAFSDRNPEIFHPMGGKLKKELNRNHHTMGGDSEREPIRHLLQEDTKDKPIRHPLGGEFQPIETNDVFTKEEIKGFHPNLSWSHYRVLMQVENGDARNFYETEAVECGWNRRELERQVHSLYYDRLLASKDKKGMLQEVRSKNGKKQNPLEMIKDPYILEFLDLPKQPRLYESQVESAIIANLQNFLLELGKGFLLKQIFASKYKTYLPTEEELQREIERERMIIEEQQAVYWTSKESPGTEQDKTRERHL